MSRTPRSAPPGEQAPRTWTASLAQQETEPASLEAFFSYGFRPFFLGAGVVAALTMALWLIWITLLAAGIALPAVTIAHSPHMWHAHEMVMGFGMAAVAGFLLTAVPNWTGALPLSGRPLAVLFAIWLAGRLAMTVSAALPGVVVAILDLAFVPAIATAAARQLLVQPQRKNMVFLAILAVMGLANLAFHLDHLGLVRIDEALALRLALMGLVAMIAVIGGRIIPAFTHNWLHLNAIPGAMPKRDTRVDLAAVISLVVFALLWGSGVSDKAAGVVGLVAAILNGMRLAGWRGLATFGAPIVAVLHVGYAWIVAGLTLAALSGLLGVGEPVLAVHAFGTGAVGTMILAVMTRAALGHTGRPLTAPRPIVGAYALVTIAALLRVLGPLLLPGLREVWMLLGGLAWMAAFTLFAVVYWPILTRPRLRSRPQGA